VKRRAFIALIGGAAAWPLAAGAQQGERMRRVGVLLPASADHPLYQLWYAAFLQGLAVSGWNIGRNLRLETRWATTNPADIRRHAAELVALAPDVILAHGTSTVVPLHEVAPAIPIVFALVADPVAAGIVQSLARPGGAVTGFMPFDFSIGSKWLEILKDIAPNVTRAGVFRDPTNPTGIAAFSVIQSMAPSLRMEVVPLNMRDAHEIERAVVTLSASGNGGLILTPSGPAHVYGKLILTLAAQQKLPAVCFERSYAADGGLVSYGPDFGDQYRRAAGYVDRILKGEKPADLPVQAPTKYELVINFKTAKALGLEVPQSLLARADEVIE
jgi:putative tryptophan/tyrosine transport system substrate-binding protein